jgi:hypothetical protein
LLGGDFASDFFFVASSDLIVVVVGGVIPAYLEVGLSGCCVRLGKHGIPIILLPVEMGLS